MMVPANVHCCIIAASEQKPEGVGNPVEHLVADADPRNEVPPGYIVLPHFVLQDDKCAPLAIVGGYHTIVFQNLAELFDGFGLELSIIWEVATI